MSDSKEIFTNAFVDLMASALGCVVIMMLIFAVKKPNSQKRIGKPRGFVYYSFETKDDNAELEFYFKHSTDNTVCPIVHKKLKDLDNKPGPDAIELCENFSAYMWGPTQDNLDDKSKRYNFYAVLGKKGEWYFGVRYYDRTTLNADALKAGNTNPVKEIRNVLKITQRSRTNDITKPDSSFEIRLGDECNLSLKIE